MTPVLRRLKVSSARRLPVPVNVTVTPPPACLAHADGRQYEFAPQPGGDVLVTLAGRRQFARYAVPVAEARELYTRLLKGGFVRF